jgi:hypothetical protein
VGKSFTQTLRRKFVKKLLYSILVLVLLLAFPMAALANQGTPSMSNLENRGWICEDIAGDYHCFNPAFLNNKNTSTIQVMVFNYDGKFLGTEILWSVDIYAGQPCPQDQLLFLGPYVACHRYAP